MTHDRMVIVIVVVIVIRPDTPNKKKSSKCCSHTGRCSILRAGCAVASRRRKAHLQMHVNWSSRHAIVRVFAYLDIALALLSAAGPLLILRPLQDAGPHLRYKQRKRGHQN